MAATIDAVCDSGIWGTVDDFSGICPSAPPPSPEVPTRRFSSPLDLLAESILLNGDLLDRAKDSGRNSPGLPSISVAPPDSREALDHRDGFYDHSGSFSSSCSSSERYEDDPNNEEEMEIQESMEISENGCSPQGAQVSPTTYPTGAMSGLTVSTSSFPIPSPQTGLNMSHHGRRVAYSWHQGMGGLAGVSPPSHKPLSQSFSCNEYDRTRRRSFSKRRQAEKASALEAGDCGGGLDSMECEMSGKKSCQESVAVAYEAYPNTEAPFPLANSSCQMSTYLSSPHLQAGGSPNLLQPPPPLTRTGRLSEPALTTETFDPTLSRSL